MPNRQTITADADNIVELEPDVYQFLLRSSARIGESASSILRRLLQIEPPHGDPIPQPSVQFDWPLTDPVAIDMVAFLRGVGARKGLPPTVRYLLILGKLAEAHPVDFKRLVGRRGRKRIMVGHSPDHLNDSGISVHPQPIPNSPYWATTNGGSRHKADFLALALEELGYGRSVSAEARAAILG